MADVRQRKPVAEKTVTPAALAKKEDGTGISVLDIFRTIAFVLLASSAASYFVTKESFAWGLQRPNWSRVDVIKGYLKGPRQYTDADLAEFDGSDPEKPIFLAINGTIYDVSNGRRHYGPGGSYHFFAGHDASRAFVTSCFDTDLNPDMRGVEEMYIPLNNPIVDSRYSSAELKKLKQRERRDAKIEVHKALKHWVDFFEKSRKYTKVGPVKREKGWETKGEKPVLCQKAQEGRLKSRKFPDGSAYVPPAE